MDIVTHAHDEREQNPVLPELQVMIDTGSWPRTNISINMVKTVYFWILQVHLHEDLPPHVNIVGNVYRVKDTSVPPRC